MFITETGDAPAAARDPADKQPALAALPELVAVCRIARAHARAAGAFVARAGRGTQRVLAADGAVPDPLPADCFPAHVERDPSAGRRYVIHDLRCDDGPPHAPHIVAACELTAADGTTLGTLCISNDTP